ncbi:winged helix-turn-helix transcriptional regulator [Salana multivorans]
MPRRSFGEFSCSVARAVDVVGDSWTPLILRDVFLGVDQFDDLVRDLGISRALLTTRLGHLTDAGILEAELYQDRPARHRYRLTAAGSAARPDPRRAHALGRPVALPGGPTAAPGARVRSPARRPAAVRGL